MSAKAKSALKIPSTSVRFKADTRKILAALEFELLLSGELTIQLELIELNKIKEFHAKMKTFP